MKRFKLGRRALLRGLAGAALPLPWLEAMSPPTARAQAALLPKRYVVTFGGLSSGDPSLIVPDTLGAGYDVKRALAPLMELNVRDEVSVISGLRMPQDGPGGWTGRWHSSSLGPLVSGVQASGQGAPGAQLSSHGDPRARGITSDQVVANAIAADTRFQSLHYRVQPEVYRENDATFGVISYRDDGNGVEPNEPTHSPRLAYDSLFTGFQPTEADPTSELTLARDVSVLDLVGRRAERLMARLGTADRRRVERHFDEIRNLEMLLQDVPQPTSAICQPFADPGEDPPVSLYQNGSFDEGGVTIQRYLGYADENRRAQLMTDLLHMALTCDLTRSATLAYTFAQCFIDTSELLGMQRTDVHELGHGAGSDEDVADAIAWHVRHFATLVGKLRDTPEGDGNVLDNTVLVFLMEGGWDAGEPHTGENMVALVAGRAGGLVPGQHVNGAGRHPASALISAMNAAGVATDQLGEIAGGIDELFG